MLQHAATRCNTLQWSYSHLLQDTATLQQAHRHLLQHTDLLQHTALEVLPPTPHMLNKKRCGRQGIRCVAERYDLVQYKGRRHRIRCSVSHIAFFGGRRL